MHNLNRGQNVAQKCGVLPSAIEKTAQSKQLPIGQKFAQSGHSLQMLKTQGVA
jgi:hypothetical protein